MPHDDDAIGQEDISNNKMLKILLDEIVDVRNELKGEMADLKNDLKTDIRTVDAKVDALGKDVKHLSYNVSLNHSTLIKNTEDLHTRVSTLESIIAA